MGSKNYNGGLGLSLASLTGGDVVPAGQVRTVLGLTLCNKHTDAVTVKLATRNPGSPVTDRYVLWNFQLPVGDTHVPYGLFMKKILNEGADLVGLCSVDAVVDFDLNVDDDDVEV